ncbi:MAG TPA: CHAT domain-containing protein [Anaerolineales bacterium]|nr:CHAT domain-containing protein [Anaerolineales bacterium]HRF50448.1 CHAT domain-containing protein [Anaerolineales bacterium]
MSTLNSVPHTRGGPLPEPIDLVAAWRAGDEAARVALVSRHVGAVDEAYAQKLKVVADHALRNDLRECLDIADLLLALGAVTNVAPIRALGLLVRANGIGIGRGDYAAAIPDYETAANIYLGLDRPVDAARSRIGQVYALAVEKQDTAAISVGDTAADILRQAQRWDSLAALLMNMAAIHGRSGQDRLALLRLNEVRDLCLRLGASARGQLAQVEVNRSIVLRNLGMFDESIAAAKKAQTLAADLDMPLDTANANECLAITYAILGRYNDALLLFQRTLEILEGDGRQRDAALVELSISNSLLKLGRLIDGLEHARRARLTLERLGGRIEIGQASLFEAEILASLDQTESAQAAIALAQEQFSAERSTSWLAQADLARASLIGRRGLTQESLDLAIKTAGTFDDLGQRHHAAFARLLAARTALRLGHSDQAYDLATSALDTGQLLGASDIVQPAYQTLGEIERRAEHLDKALDTFEKSMAELERVRGQMMIEDRSFFLRNKLSIYEDAVEASLASGRPARGLGYAERAKSRALLDMLDQRVSVRLEAQSPEDQPLVAELLTLRAQRDETVRRWQGEHALVLRDAQPGAAPEIRGELARIEKRITVLWNRLLMRNATYSHQADLWQVPDTDIAALLPTGATLLEYFVVHGKLVAFVGRSGRIQARHLDLSVEKLNALLRPLQLNLATCQDSAGRGLEPGPHLLRNAQSALRRLYEALIAPVRDDLTQDTELIIVPHGQLHYLPFAALFDGASYLNDAFTLRLLPSAGLLRHLGSSAIDPSGGRSGPGRFLAIGYSSNDQLPAARAEALSIAARMSGDALIEDEATAAALLERAPQLRALHLATHAEFRADNPLFSGLALADGWLTTLDLFNWRLNASLVTLSACQTGRSVIGGGDEILGLLRALLYAGAQSVVASLWPVQDAATAQLMERFYAGLAAGLPKSLALRDAQRTLRQNGLEHPYYWAPFFLVGDSGPL